MPRGPSKEELMELVKEWEAAGKPSFAAFAKMIGKPRRTVSDWFTVWAERHGITFERPSPLATYDPSMHNYGQENVPDPYVMRGVSQLVDAEGNTKLTWIKSGLDKAQFTELLKEYVDLFYAGIEPLSIPKAPKVKYDDDVIPWFQIGDAHIGMLAHEAETGHNFDLKIATSELASAIGILFDEVQPCKRCVINDLGDFTHYENYAGETEASGHRLDYDGRFPKMIKAYIPLMRFIVDKALEKFEHVDIIINQGNHSRTNDVWMSLLLKNVYENTGRVTVLDNSNIFIPYRMGNTFVMVHHSDKAKHPRLAHVMATDYAKHWGESTFRYIDIGHVHHSFTSKEHPGVKIESWNNLAPRDKYAHEGGWRSRQAITRVDRSKTYGEIGRRVLSIEEIHDKVRKGMTAHSHPEYQPHEPRKKVHEV